MNIIKLTLVMLFSLLLLGCIEEKKSDNSLMFKGTNSQAISRSIASKYEVMKRTGVGEVCYKEPDKKSEKIMMLTNQSHVNLISNRSGLIHNKGDYWIHINVQNRSNINCYIDIKYLIPIPEY